MSGNPEACCAYMCLCLCMFIFVFVYLCLLPSCLQFICMFTLLFPSVFILAQKFKYVLVEITVNSIQKEMKKDSSVSTNAAKHRNCRHSPAF